MAAEAATHSHTSCGLHASAFSDVPPGLGELGSFSVTSPLTTTQAAEMGDSVENANGGDVSEVVRQALMRDLDVKVTEKVEAMWQKGKQMLTQVQAKNQEKTDKITTEITRVLERQRALEAENEQLKQVLMNLAQRLSFLGNTFGGNGATTCCGASDNTNGNASTTNGSSSTTATGSPQQTQGSSDAFTPTHVTPSESFGAGLPEVPSFPFPPAQSGVQSAAAPLSLAEALGAQSPQQTLAPTPLSLASSLPTTSSLEVFTFTLRKADETDLGLHVSHLKDEADHGALCVEGVREGGAVGAWNRQCMGGAYPEKAVLPGDKIVSVNNIVYDPEKMLEECKDKRLLKLTIARGEGQLPDLSTLIGNCNNGTPTTATPVNGTLRADASEFVPRADAPEFVPMTTPSPTLPQIPAEDAVGLIPAMDGTQEDAYGNM